MIIVDASIWIDQIRRPDAIFADLLYRQVVVMHPFIAGEIMLGSMKDRAQVGATLAALDPAPVAEPDEVANLIESAVLFGTGIGYVDVHLIASALLMVGGRIWTRDRRLHNVAERLGIALAIA
ncbi:MAG: VapC toxin family PIN domain ribonuclease [Sandarakinorhabdus sp.]|nr:VapC toxin family PIN domain ribonuclease [Sandarakinorhabdus sp.]